MSELEELLLFQIRAVGLPEPVREYRALPERRWRWDFAWPEARLLVEVQGKRWGLGAHTSGKGTARDWEKNNLAVLSGWRVLYAWDEAIESGKMIEWILRILSGVGGESHG